MADDADTLRARLNRLAASMELAQRASPEDSVRAERTITIVVQAREAVLQARQAAYQARVWVAVAKAVAQRLVDGTAGLKAELQVMRVDTSK
jgi:hypothetical protein